MVKTPDFLPDENAFGLHSVGRVPLTLAATYIPSKNTSHCITFFFFLVYNKPKAKLIYNANHIEHYRKCIITHKTQLHFISVYFQLEYAGDFSLTREGRLSPEQTIAKATCKLHSQYL